MAEKNPNEDIDSKIADFMAVCYFIFINLYLKINCIGHR